MNKLIAIIVGIVVIIVLVLILNPFVIISAGEKGVVMNWGAVSDNILSEGIHWRTPIAQSVKKIDIRMQKEEIDASAASKDLQNVSSKVALNYHLDPDKVNILWQKIGSDYKIRVIDPAIQEAVKAATAKYTAEELNTKRESVKEDIKTALKTRLQVEYITVDEFSIINFDFSPEFNKSIEAKQTAVQQALKAENDLRRIKTEAEQRVATAEAEAKAISVQSKAADNDKYIQLKTIEAQVKAIERWDGKLPTTFVPGSALPFINIIK
jgi:regulator of protease activity HflC (stomatin/prohibitin superfamily)